ncbi:hypothetical protein C8F01DRAFT_1321160, partial [Mycena amicta]
AIVRSNQILALLTPLYRPRSSPSQSNSQVSNLKRHDLPAQKKKPKRSRISSHSRIECEAHRNMTHRLVLVGVLSPRLGLIGCRLKAISERGSVCTIVQPIPNVGKRISVGNGEVSSPMQCNPALNGMIHLCKKTKRGRIDSSQSCIEREAQSPQRMFMVRPSVLVVCRLKVAVCVAASGCEKLPNDAWEEQACSSLHQRCSERESQSESDGETKIGRNKPHVAFTSRTRTEGSVGHEGTTDALQNGEVLKNESWNEWVSRPVPKALPGFRKGEDEPENTKLERSYQEPQAR